VAGGDRRNANDRLAVELAAGKAVADAADAAGVSERTAYRRLDDAGFRGRVTTLRGDMIGRAVGQLADASTKAVQTLTELLVADSATVRLGAARSILELGMRLRDANEIEERLSTLEQKVENGEFAKSPFAARKTNQS
jgi:tetrahydromethanopterin S-methyltransferase subunit G